MAEPNPTHRSSLEIIRGQGLRPFSLVLIDKLRLGRFGAAGAWALLALLAFGLVVPSLIGASAPWRLTAAMALAAFGFFLCGFGSIWGLRVLIDAVPALALVLGEDANLTRERLLERLVGRVSFSVTSIVGLLFGVAITPTLYLFHAGNPSLAAPFLEGRAFYLALIFMSAFGIGVGHVCIFGALALSSLIRDHGIRKILSVYRVHEFSHRYLLLATLSLLIYVTYLSYLWVSWSSNQALYPVMLLTGGVGLVVAVFYVYPQMVIFMQLRRNKHELLEDAIASLEEATRDIELAEEQRKQKILQAVEYLAMIEKMPTIGCRLREFLIVTASYVLPTLWFYIDMAQRR